MRKREIVLVLVVKKVKEWFCFFNIFLFLFFEDAASMF